MAAKVQSNFRHRTNLGRVESIEEIPNLIDIQKSSYDKFLTLSQWCRVYLLNTLTTRKYRD